MVFGTEIVAFVSGAGPICMPYGGPEFMELLEKVNQDTVDADITRCPEPAFADKMRAEITAARDAHDSIGGIVTCVVRRVPAGLGEPCFDKLEAKLAHAMLSIPATKGFEIGSGFSGTQQRGSEHNDTWIAKSNNLGTTTNNSGGIQVFSKGNYY